MTRKSRSIVTSPHAPVAGPHRRAATRRRRRLGPLRVAPLAVAMMAGALNTLSPGAPAQAVAGGTAVTAAGFASDWSFVVALRSAGGGICTGTLVGPATVVTAAHCINSTDFVVSYGSADLATASSVAISSVSVNPAYNANSLTGDSAIVQLAANVSGATPIRVLTPAEGEALHAGVAVSFAGFGRTETGLPTVLHAASSSSYRLDGKWEVAGSPNVCSGDSGGPLVTSLPTGERVLLGATSSGDAGCAGLVGMWTDLGRDSFIQANVPNVKPTFTAVSPLAYLDYTDGGALVYFTTSAVDRRGPVPVSCVPPMGSRFAFGTTSVTCTASNDTGVSSTTFPVTVNRADAPVLNVVVTPTSGTTPLTVSIDMTGSRAGAGGRYAVDPTGHPENFSENAVDSSEPISMSFTYRSAGTYAIYSELYSPTGQLIAQKVTPVVVTDPLPVIIASVTPTSGIAPLTVRFDMTGSGFADGRPALYAIDPTWNIAEDTRSENFASASAPIVRSFTYEQPGTYEARLYAFDAATRRLRVFRSVTITVTAASPTLRAPTSVIYSDFTAEGALVAFTVTADDPLGAGLPVSCLPASGSRFRYGSTSVTCRATNTAGATGTVTFPVNVVDDTPPAYGRATNLTVDPISPEGARVTFTIPNATDAVGVVSNTCDRASGSVFPIGTTEVRCTARDAAGNTASTDFTVTVRSPADLITSLRATVDAFRPPALGRSLVDKLAIVQRAVSTGDQTTACGTMGAFISQVNAQSSKTIPKDQARSLVERATLIRMVMGC